MLKTSCRKVIGKRGSSNGGVQRETLLKKSLEGKKWLIAGSKPAVINKVKFDY